MASEIACIPPPRLISPWILWICCDQQSISPMWVHVRHVLVGSCPHVKHVTSKPITIVPSLDTYTHITDKIDCASFHNLWIWVNK